jgi:hypothetical protein
MKEFLSAFNWAVPIAFSDAVNLCRFEEGDTLYDDSSAYNECWEEAKDKINYCLQVKYPARSSSSVKGSGGVFEKNWTSEVRVDLYKNLTKINSIITTQGKLYTVLWKNDLKVLESNLTPSIPIRLKQVMVMLKEKPKGLSNYSKNHLTFVLPRDISNPISKVKYQKVYSALNPYLQSREPIILSPKDAGLLNCESIAPTIDIVLFPVKLKSEDELAELIKLAVYVPTKNAKKSMFRVASHGLILDCSIPWEDI